MNSNAPLQTEQCAIHGYEPVPDDYYRICGECGHCFVSAWELIQQDYVINTEINNAGVGYGWWTEENKPVATYRDPQLIYACPFCSHDF